MEGGAQGSRCFWSKTAEHLVQCGQVHSQTTHHETGKHVDRASPNNASWNTDAEEFLEHCRGGGRPVPQGALPSRKDAVLGGSPLAYHA